MGSTVIDEQLITDPKDPNWGLTAPPKQDEAKPPVSRVGIATSVIAPELEQARGVVNAATAMKDETPIMARSRTGALYRSSVGDPSNIPRAFGNVAGNAAIDAVEGVTSPLGAVAAAAPFAAPYVKPAAAAIVKGAAALGDVIHPDIVGMVSPKIANALRVAQRVVAAAKEAAPEQAPKMTIKAMDYLRIKSLIEQGIPQGEAVSTVMNLRVKGKL